MASTIGESIAKIDKTRILSCGIKEFFKNTQFKNQIKIYSNWYKSFYVSAYIDYASDFNRFFFENNNQNMLYIHIRTGTRQNVLFN